MAVIDFPNSPTDRQQFVAQNGATYEYDLPNDRWYTLASKQAFGAGTVTSVNATGTRGIKVTGGPITSAGSLQISLPIVDLPVIPSALVDTDIILVERSNVSHKLPASLIRAFAGQVRIGPSAPSPAIVGMLWWSTTKANLYIRTSDNKWVPASQVDTTEFPKTSDVYLKSETYSKKEVYNKGETYSKTEVNAKFVDVAGDVINGDLTVVSLNGSSLGGFRNRIINGGMSISQRGKKISITKDKQYSLDRWYHSFDGNATKIKREVDQIDLTPGNIRIGVDAYRSLKYVKSQITPLPKPPTVPVVNTYEILGTKIEFLYQFHSRQVTLSFKSKLVTSLTSAVIEKIVLRQNFGTGGSASVDTVLATNVPVTENFVLKSFTVTLPSISGKNIKDNNCLEVLFYLPKGDTTTFTFEITAVQLEPGSKPTLFEVRGFDIESLLCQRYYFERKDGDDNPILSVYNSSPQQRSIYYHWRVPMRSTPTIRQTFTGAILREIKTSTNGVRFTANATNTATVSYLKTLIAEAEL